MPHVLLRRNMTDANHSNVLFATALLFHFCLGNINSVMIPVEVPPNATYIAGDKEHRMAYWREDLGLNLFHWHWHLYHPWSTNETKEFIINKDRRGELFYYTHEQMLARYHVDRMCNHLNDVTPFSNWDTPIPGAYHPMLSSDVAGGNWSARPANMKLSSMDRPDFPGGAKFDIKDMRIYAKRILEAIERRKLVAANGTEIPIDNDRGIDILGDTVEATDNLSPNHKYYGNLHNYGHVALGHILDPQSKYDTPPGVMYMPNTAVRDPVFYRWHVYLNDIYQKNKATLQAYDTKMLSFPLISVTNVELCSHRGGKCGLQRNTLHTYMAKSDFNMTRGIDFLPRKPFLVRMTHLNHDDFDYTIDYINWYHKKLMGTVRIFLIPVIGFDNKTMKLSEQRNFAIEMDRFVQPLKPGRNRIVRKSTMSSVTIPFSQTFRDLDTNRPKDDEYEAFDKFNTCGCGWPHHLLVPKGTAKGYPMLLFALITDYRKDQVNQNLTQSENGCKIGDFCALRHKKYPFKLPNGFPFDRPIRSGADNIWKFMTRNMAIKPITIFHSDKVRQGRVLSNAKPTILGKGHQQV